MRDATNILIVDDEEAVCQLLSEAMSQMGFKAVATSRPAEALEIAKGQWFDLALLDINMPQMDGVSLARGLRAIHTTLGIIFISNYGSFDNALEAIKLGVSDFIRKPVKLDDLLISVTRVTERLRLEREVQEKTELLRQSEEQYRILVENTADGVALFSSGKLIFQNRAFSRLLGLDSMTLHRRAFVDLLHPDDRNRAIQDAGRILKGQLIGPVRYRFRKSDGQYCWMSVNSAVVDYGGKPIILSTFRDITPLVEMDNVRKDMEKMLRHDMRSHLVSIIGLANRLLSKTELDATQREHCRQIEHSGRELERMVETYLDITRLEHGAYKPQQERFNLMDIVTQARSTFREMADRKNVDLVIIFNKAMYTLEHEMPFVGDKIYLQNALNNILKNAIEASPLDRTVKIKVKQDDGRVLISVHNWGVIPEQIRSCFFEKYATAGKKHGTGLGTYMAHLVITSHGGAISFSSTEDEGTTVEMDLPLKAA